MQFSRNDLYNMKMESKYINIYVPAMRSHILNLNAIDTSNIYVSQQ